MSLTSGPNARHYIVMSLTIQKVNVHYQQDKIYLNNISNAQLSYYSLLANLSFFNYICSTFPAQDACNIIKRQEISLAKLVLWLHQRAPSGSVLPYGYFNGELFSLLFNCLVHCYILSRHAVILPIQLFQSRFHISFVLFTQ